jgi:heterodisulfide reductase subunit B
MKYAYYPGCSLEKNAASYHISAMATAKALGIEFVEIDDWNCCGATEFIAVNRMAAYSLVARNLVLAKKKIAESKKTNGNGKTKSSNGAIQNQLIAPCSACFLNLSKAEHYLTEHADLRDRVNIALAEGGMKYTGGDLNVRHLLDIYVNDVGYAAIKEKVVKPLKGLRIAPYYGCLIVRPRFQGVFDDFEHPVTLDRLVKSLGATVIDFPLKAQCCGGHMTQLSEDVSLELLNRLLRNAAEYETDIMVTLCPMCQLNLDAYQEAVNKRFGTNYKIPILYFTQLIGLALGISPEALGIGSEFVDARPALSKIGIELPPPQEPAKKKRPSKEELPMPRMPESEEV